MTPPPIKNSPPSPWDVIHNFRDYSQGQRDLHLNSGKKRKREFSGGHGARFPTRRCVRRHCRRFLRNRWCGSRQLGIFANGSRAVRREMPSTACVEPAISEKSPTIPDTHNGGATRFAVVSAPARSDSPCGRTQDSPSEPDASRTPRGASDDVALDTRFPTVILWVTAICPDFGNSRGPSTVPVGGCLPLDHRRPTPDRALPLRSSGSVWGSRHEVSASTGPHAGDASGQWARCTRRVARCVPAGVSEAGVISRRVRVLLLAVSDCLECGGDPPPETAGAGSRFAGRDA